MNIRKGERTMERMQTHDENKRWKCANVRVQTSIVSIKFYNAKWQFAWCTFFLWLFHSPFHIRFAYIRSKQHFFRQEFAFSFQFQHEFCSNDVYIIVASFGKVFLLVTNKLCKNMGAGLNLVENFEIREHFTRSSPFDESNRSAPHFYLHCQILTTSIFTSESNRLQCDTNKYKCESSI